MARIDGLKDERGLFMHGWKLYPYLERAGLMKNEKLLPEGGALTVNGVRLVVSKPPVALYYQGHKVKSSRHRVFAQCDCDKWIPFGRLGQHRKACRADVFFHTL